ncbi:MAG TPA: response regulator [Caulobacterales bacterium]|nr:response regulator [Caulobacterales bacterium]
MRPEDKANILLVDDQPAKLMSYEIILGELNENLLKASSAKEALEILLKNDIAVILIDVCMPELDGFELAQMIREHPRFQQTAIIFISAIHLTEIDSLKGYEMGGVDYVPVPVVPGILRAKVRVFVDLFRKTRQLERLNNELEGRVAARTAELEAAIARQDLLAREVDHRAKNALAVIQSIVTLTRAETSTDFAQAVHGRIHAMARAHSLLAQSRWDGADFTRLINEELEPYAAIDRLRVSGPVVLIKPMVAQNIALAIHELATNAAKYGALSAPDGRVKVDWELDGDCLKVRWAESGGPAVTKPSKIGFGAKVIRAGVTAQLGGEVDFEWRKAGLVCTMLLPREHFTPAPFSAKAGATREEAPPPMVNGQSIAGKRILLVEDEPLVAMMMAQILNDLGAHVVGPVSALAEAASISPESIDAAVLDVNIEGEYVYPVADQLAACGAPFVFVTGYEAESIEARFSAAPVLAKPIEPQTLADALASALEARAPRRAVSA